MLRIACARIGAALAIATILSTAVVATASARDVILRAAHQFPGNKGDPRDEMLQMIARDVEAANVGLKIQVFPGASLYKPYEQWGALTKGQLDISSFPLDYASDRVPQFSATLMPGLVRNFDRAERLNTSPFMDEIRSIAKKHGAVVIADAWLSGAFASRGDCITGPDSIKGKVARTLAPAFEEMLTKAGATTAATPSSGIYSGMQTGALDVTNTSSASLVSYRLHEQTRCLTAPGENALWFMYEPVLMSRRTFDRLNPKQQEALLKAGQKAEEWFAAEARKDDQKMIDTYRKAGVEIVEMSSEDFNAWLKVAQDSAYKSFSEKVKGGDELIKKALAVE